MGPAQSRLPIAHALSKPTKKDGWLGSLRETRQGIKSTLGYSASTVPDEIPPDNIFTPIQQDDILPQIPIGRHHPVPRTGVEDDDRTTMHTNSFYANAFLGQQNQPIWTHPYSIWWGKGTLDVGMVQTWGMCISHIEEKDLVFEPGDPAKGYINPLHKQHLVLSAVELNARTTLTTDTHLPFSVNINLKPHPEAQEPKITFPVVQGMSFITAGYRGATPMIQTGGRGFVDLAGPIVISPRTVKYRLKDKAGRCWIVYVNPVASLDYDATRFVRLNSNTLLGPPAFKGTIQVAKNPLGLEGEAIYDRASGTFVCEAKLTAVVPDGKGIYTFRYTKIGTSPLLMFALPHHVRSLHPEMRNQVTNLCLRTTTKGMATAIWGDKLTFIEPNLPLTMHFSPWNPTMNANAKIRYPPEVLAFIAAVAERDLRRAMTERIPQDSLYFAGKSLAKFATIVWIIKDVLSHDAIATAGLEKLKVELARYVDNAQRHPLYYDDSWKGVVSSAGFSDPGADFGNTYYNDHHLQYAYFVYTASVIGALDPAWLTQGDNKSWTNMLVKDFAESDYNGRDYPFSRSFDWWHGHSWAKGLFEAADGKDMESTGEDAFASYAVKMWGKVVGDADMEKRGNLQLAIQARSFNHYMYIRSTNTNHPLRYTQNKVAGALFENKVDHAKIRKAVPLSQRQATATCQTETRAVNSRPKFKIKNKIPHIDTQRLEERAYVSLAPALIHGIHIVPINPSTSLIRPRSFVKEEWETFFTEGRANVEGGWRGILYANLALIDAKASYTFFRDGIDGFWDERWIDGGASRTLYLVWAAALGEFAKAGR